MLDVTRGRETILGALGDGGIVVAIFAGAAVALHIDAPAIESAPREPVHHRRIRPAIDMQIEGWLPGHRRAVDEQDCAGFIPAIATALLEQKQPHPVGLLGPMVFGLDRRGVWLGLLVHRGWDLSGVRRAPLSCHRSIALVR